jgi:hypothetical protein
VAAGREHVGGAIQRRHADRQGLELPVAAFNQQFAFEYEALASTAVDRRITRAKARQDRAQRFGRIEPKARLAVGYWTT